MSARRPPPPVERVAGGYLLHLGSAERDVLAGLLGELRDMITAGSDHAALRRLHPPAYHLADDSAAEAEYQRLMADELAGSRLAAVQAVIDALAAPHDSVLDGTAITGWLQSVNSLRLVLGTILDVQEDDDPDVDDDDPSRAHLGLYEFLGFLLDATVRAVSDELPDR